MNIEKMNTLIIEDNVFKYMAIKRAIAGCKSSDFTHASALTEAKEILLKAEEMGGKFHLIVTDMNYPDKNTSETNPNAGFEFIEFMNSLGVSIPVIICSTRKFQVDGEDNVIGAIRYSPNTDLDFEFQTLLRKL